MYIDKLDDIVNKYNISQRTIKMKPVVVKSSTYIEYKNNNKEHPKSNASDYVRISKHKKFFCKWLCSKLVRKSFCDQKS